MKKLKVGILAFHGDVIEHIQATDAAAQKLRMSVEVSEVRTKADLADIDALIIPGGESPTLQKLCQRENMWTDMKKVKNIFGTCAGAIMLAKHIDNTSENQETLELMDIEITRNAYGRQTESFQEAIDTDLGKMEAVFIRAPKIKVTGKAVHILAQRNGETIACQEKTKDHFYLAATFHPELTTTKFHEYFLKQIS
jgi:5'-phosphate synthase pdxT subunit